MSIAIGMQSDKGMSAVPPASTQEDLSDNEDGSSSLSDIEDREADQEGMEPVTSDIENGSEGNDSDDNDTEAETERLEDSPHSTRKHKDVIMRPYTESKTYERSPSKLQNQLLAAANEDEEPPTGDEDSDIESAKSRSDDEDDHNPPTAPTSLDSTIEEPKPFKTPDGPSKKRKRHTIMDGGVADDSEHNEPATKRVGSILDSSNTYLDEDEDALVDEDIENSNHVSGEDGAEDQDDNEDLQHIAIDKGPLEILAEASSKKAEKRSTRQSQDITQNGLEGKSQGPILAAAKLNGVQDPSSVGDEPDGPAYAEEYDEAEVALKNEEEVEKKRTAVDQLSGIEKHLRTFRIRLYEERIAQLELEEAQLKQDTPTHPEYLAMVQCIDERRDERIRIAERLKEYSLQTARNFAVSRRSQILGQYAQTVRDTRETKLEVLGKQWYDIQNDRRRCSGSVPDYAYKFSEKRSQHITNQMSYNKEVSILSGIAKYVGFPAAPPMSTATPGEIEDDIERMGTQAHHQQPRIIQPLQEFRALKAAESARYKPAEEQFIEQHIWANAQHPLHAAHRQSSAQQVTRTSSPFGNSSGPMRRYSHQPNGGSTPATGAFSSAAASNLPYLNGQISPPNPFSMPGNTHKIIPSRQPSPSLQQHISIQYTEHALPHHSHKELSHETSHSNSNFGSYEAHRDFGYDGVSRAADQASAQNGR